MLLYRQRNLLANDNTVDAVRVFGSGHPMEGQSPHATFGPVSTVCRSLVSPTSMQPLVVEQSRTCFCLLAADNKRCRQTLIAHFLIDITLTLFSSSIGYPVVTLGFGFKSYVGYRIRQRKQREVAKENEFYMQLLQQALPQEDSASSSAQPDDTSTSLASTDHIINHSMSDHLQKELPSTQLSPIHNNQQHHHHSNHHKNAQNSSNNKSLNLSTTSPTSLTAVSSTSTSPATTTANGHTHHSSSNGVSQSSHKNNRRSLDKDRGSEGKSTELSNSRNHSAYQQSSYTKEPSKTFVTTSDHSSTTSMLFPSPSSSSSASSLSSVSSKGGVQLSEKDSSSIRNSDKDKQNGAYDYHQQNSVGNKLDTKGSGQTNGGSSGNKNNNSNADGSSPGSSSSNSHNKHNSYTEVNVEAVGKSSLKSNGSVLNVDNDYNNHHQQPATETTELIEKVKGKPQSSRPDL